jgi:hypothetical protein
LNAWLLDKCIAYAKAHRHPELPEQTVWEVSPPANILTPAALTLRHAPIADCARYDNLGRTRNVLNPSPG